MNSEDRYRRAALGLAVGIAAALIAPLGCRDRVGLSSDTAPVRRDVAERQPSGAAEVRSAPKIAEPLTLGNLFDRVLWAMDVVADPSSPVERQAEARGVLAWTGVILERLAIEPDAPTSSWCGTNDILKAGMLKNIRGLIAAWVGEATAMTACMERADVTREERRDAILTVRSDLDEVRRLHEKLRSSEWGRDVLARRLVPGAPLEAAPATAPAVVPVRATR